MTTAINKKNDMKIGAGMVNMGNTCYLNAALQALFNLHDFGHWLISEWKDDCYTKTNYKDSCIICAVAHVLKITKSNFRAIKPMLVYYKLKEINPLLKVGEQNDSHEFLKSILQSMANVVVQSGKKDRVSEIFYGVVVSTVKCLVCNTKTEATEDFTELVLNIESVQSVDRALDFYFKKECIEGFECSTCKKKVNATRQYFIKKFPKTLCVVLNRFPNRFEKIKDPKKLSKEMNLAKYASDTSLTPMKYRVNSLISHIGQSQFSGHYTTIARKNLTENELYYECNDALVEEVAFNDNTTANAYIIFYERVPNPGNLRNNQEGRSTDNPECMNPVEITDEVEQRQIHILTEILSNDNWDEWTPIEIIDVEDIGQAHSEAHDIEMIDIESESEVDNVQKQCPGNEAFDVTINYQSESHEASWWKIAKKFEAEALNEEIRLAKENGEVDSAGNALIAVEIDGSYGKRSYTNNFTSLSGCAAIIGLKTKKILYSGVKNKYCHVCTIAKSKERPPPIHECNKNYDGPSCGMETQIIVEGFKFCAEKGARFHKFIADGDASTYKALRDLRLYKDPDVYIEKFECVNHLFRNFTKKCNALSACTKLKLRGRKLLPPALGRNISKGVRKAADHWQKSDIDPVKKYENLRKDIMNAPLHYLGVHDNCEKYFCNKTTDPQARSVIAVLKESGVYYEVLNVCQFYFANNVKSLIAGLTTNKTEGFNSLIAKTLGGKRVCNSLDGSYGMRTSISDVHYNTEGHSGSTFHELIFGNSMQSCLNLENKRKRKNAKNAIAKAETKKRKLNEEPSEEPTKKKKDKRKRYGAGREELDSTPAEFEIAKDRLLESLREKQIDRAAIEMETRAQQNSLKWTLTRQNMLTSSYFGRILNVNSRKSYSTIVADILYKNNAYSNTIENRHHGMYELEALSIFSELYNYEPIHMCGIFIDEKHSFLGATPFRLFGEDGIVVVKCPKKAYQKSFKFAINKNWIPIWTGKWHNRRINIKSHWYFELQGQLHITKRRVAYLMVYLGEFVYEILELERDDKFWTKEMEQELIFFYNEALLKELVDPRDDRGMDLRKYNAEKKTFL